MAKKIFPYEAEPNDKHLEMLREIAKLGVMKIRHGATKQVFLSRGWVKPADHKGLSGFTLTSLGYDAADIPHVLLAIPEDPDIETLAKLLKMYLSEVQIVRLGAYLQIDDAQ